MAILTASIIIFLTAIPISYHAAKYNIDIDLITRGAGFGYVGSTITSLIYASFSFIFFALEAAIMAQALELYFGLPLAWGYLLSSLIIIPLVFYGITLINKLHLWTQPIWLLMMIAPFVAVLLKEPQAVETFLNFNGTISGSSEFNIYYFGFAVGVSLALIAQIGEQVDYLRFMPSLTKENRFKWWTSMLIAGPGWIILGFLKQMGGILLAGLVLLAGFSLHEAKTPIQMYYTGYQYIFDNPQIALAAATFFVVVSQIKINVTNAYAGSLAWSNFFSRVTHSHPGRVVWMVFNIGIALLLMELGLFDALESVLGLYSNVAIAWISAITADLIINKPLGLSPKIIEFKRAYLYNFNPVGVGSMGIASVVSILSFMGMFGDMAQSYSSIIAMFMAFSLSPLIAYMTKGKYYIARPNTLQDTEETNYHCEICDNDYEKEDMSYCPLHEVEICSLCCSLDSLCHDVCKKSSQKSLREQTGNLIGKLFFGKISTMASLRIFDFTIILSLLLFTIVIAIWMVYSSQIKHLSPDVIIYFKESFTTIFFIIALIVSTLVWWVLLLQENRLLAEDELEEQNEILKKQKDVLSQQTQMIKQTHDSMISTDLEGNILTWNHGSELLFGYKEEEAIGKHISMVYRKEDLEDFSSSIETLMQTGAYSSELQFITKSKKTVWASLSISLLRDETGTPIQMVGYAQDITKRHELGKELKSSHEMLSKLSQNVPGAIYQYRLFPDGHASFPYASNGIREVYEVEPKDIVNDAQPVFDILHPDDLEMIATSIRHSANTMNDWSIQYRVNLPIKGVRWLEGFSKPEKLEDGSILWNGYINDITDRKNAENELSKQKIF
ncbi:PAS domain S-box protein [Candidatus Sulfurimonas baltica]|uniref:PAS domain S-box protein n=1 Tax=Candidatus Sulfurimonas baltica TaxID=2740404 RepID=UPI001E33EEEC|nr:PAS domain S-box protein [Candidatus Sulfurimonas baltica]